MTSWVRKALAEKLVWRGGEWEHNSIHRQMNRAAVEDSAEQWMIDEDRQLAADCVVDEGGGEGDQEVKEQA